MTNHHGRKAAWQRRAEAAADIELMRYRLPEPGGAALMLRDQMEQALRRLYLAGYAAGRLDRCH